MPKGTEQQTFFSLKVEDVFNPKLIEFFVGIGFIPQFALIFHHAPYADQQSIHTDNIGDTFRCSINWVFCKDYVMRWYKPKEGCAPTPYLVSPVGGANNAKDVPFAILDLDKAEIIEETSDKGPMLVSIGNVYHNAINLADEDRWAVIMKFTKASTPTWQHCVDTLDQWIVETR